MGRTRHFAFPLLLACFRSNFQANSFFLPNGCGTMTKAVPNLRKNTVFKAQGYVVDQSEFPAQSAVTKTKLVVALGNTCRFLKRKLKLTYVGRQRTKQGTRRLLLNLGIGAANVIQNYDVILVQTAFPALVLGRVGVPVLAQNFPSIYNVYWQTLMVLSLLAGVYTFAVDLSVVIMSVLLLVAPTVIMLILPLQIVRVILYGLKFLANTSSPLFQWSIRQSDDVGLFAKCFAGPVDEEITYRYLPALILSAIIGRSRMRTKNLQNENGSRKLFFVFFNILFGAAHLQNHFPLGAKLSDTTSLIVSNATQQSFASFLFAMFTLLPLFQQHGLAAAIGAHIAWNTIVALHFNDGLQLVGAVLFYALMRRLWLRFEEEEYFQ